MSIRTGILLLIVATNVALAGGVAHADDVAAQNTAPAQSGTSVKPLDLRPPDITKLYTSQQLQELMAKIDKGNIEEVEVQGARVPAPTFTPRVWPGIAAPFWALLHPTQAWRIFGPIPPDQARNVGTRVPYTDAYQLEPAGVPPDPLKQ
jgi:hypothetical protein